MKWSFKILAIVAAVALLPLQYILLLKVYKSLESNLYITVDECFRNAVEEESIARFDHILDSSSVYADIVSSGRNTLMDIQFILEKEGSRVDLDNLRSFFAENLADKELPVLNFRIVETENDTNVFRTADDFLSDPQAERSTFSKLSTHIVPTSSDLSRGVAAIITNPYSAILPQLRMLIIFSFLIVLFVIFCLWKMVRTLGKVNFVNNLRKDHTYAMIHDMKTPLSSIMIIAEDFKDNPVISSDEDTAEQLRILGDECRHLNTICEKVINVAKVDSKKLKFVYEKIDLEEFFDGIKAKLGALYPSSATVQPASSSTAVKTVEFTSDMSQEKWLIADRLYLTEIVDNLIDNSIKYSGREVKINARSVRRGKITELRIRDNGFGFDEDASKRLFKKFERGENTVGISGHGIGLNYVYQLMKFFGGYVRTESRKGLFTEMILGFPSRRQYEVTE